MPGFNSLARLGLAGLILALGAVGLWSHAAERGYALGKADATRAVQPYGLVIVSAEGACHVYEPGQAVTLTRAPAMAYLTTLMKLQR